MSEACSCSFNYLFCMSHHLASSDFTWQSFIPFHGKILRLHKIYLPWQIIDDQHSCYTTMKIITAVGKVIIWMVRSFKLCFNFLTGKVKIFIFDRFFIHFILWSNINIINKSNQTNLFNSTFHLNKKTTTKTNQGSDS